MYIWWEIYAKIFTYYFLVKWLHELVVYQKRFGIWIKYSVISEGFGIFFFFFLDFQKWCYYWKYNESSSFVNKNVFSYRFYEQLCNTWWFQILFTTLYYFLLLLERRINILSSALTNDIIIATVFYQHIRHLSCHGIVLCILWCQYLNPPS